MGFECPMQRQNVAFLFLALTFALFSGVDSRSISFLYPEFVNKPFINNQNVPMERRAVTHIQNYDIQRTLAGTKNYLHNPSFYKSIPSEYIVVVAFDVPLSQLNYSTLLQVKAYFAALLHIPQDNVGISQIRAMSNIIYTYFVQGDSPYSSDNFMFESLIPAQVVIDHLTAQNLENTIPVTHVAAVFEKNMRMGTSQTFIFWETTYFPYIAAICAFIVVMIVGVGVYAYVQRHKKCNKSVPYPPPKQVCLYPVVKPNVNEDGDRIQPESNQMYLIEEKATSATNPILRIKAKGLLERRGSNASLTIDLNPSQEAAVKCGTPPKECSTEEYLSSAGNRMTRKQLRQCMKDVKAVHAEFWDIPMNHPDRVEIAGCGMKNRYRSILPNEPTRVKLPEINNDPLSTYINANYIRGYDGEERAYIATQGPMANTINDFWNMVWHERAPIIVMITKLKEKNKIKCDFYLPQVSGKYGDISVTIDRVVEREGYIIREITLSSNDQDHYVLHYWYTAWPDHKAPSTAKQLLDMAREVEVLRHSSVGDMLGPVIVHCSAGIGRTGCFIATSIGMRQLQEESMVDILGIVCNMRKDRGGMIQTNEQYEFVHHALCLFEKSLPALPGD